MSLLKQLSLLTIHSTLHCTVRNGYDRPCAGVHKALIGKHWHCVAYGTHWGVTGFALRAQGPQCV